MWRKRSARRRLCGSIGLDHVQITLVKLALAVDSPWYDRPEMANKKKRKKKKKQQAQASTGKRRRMSMSQIAFVIFAVLIVTSFLVSLIAQGF